ncbi:MAG: putative O-glycosylation ligase, exosortase A system-associated [Gammaproteobacteria bacterium]|nr:putative O-glycosylation ligase, exosortase A system-associated [Gammaproteobacteria bacterium]
MRDIILIAIVLAGSLAALRRPWIGIMLWTWLSIMNPHRYTWGIAYSAPLAAVAAVSVLLGLLMTRERESPFKGSPVTWMLLFMVWMTISWLAGLDVAGDYEQWKKVMKVDVMIVISLMLLHSKQHIFALMWVCVVSIALLGAKGGFFSLIHGGGERVWGPPGSFIEDNNAFAVAVIMTIPLLRFLQLQLGSVWGRRGMTVAMLLCAVAALGSQSRGALLAITAMALYLWWNSKNKLNLALVLLVVAIPLIAFMPDTWSSRMSTIGTYEQDTSAMGRISAWWNAWNLAWHYPFGAGFNAATAELFARFSPYPDQIQGAHSIYFLALGNHGFVGLLLFVGIWVATWRSASWLRSRPDLAPEAKWCADLGSMCQVSLVGYFVGGAFLSLTYFDLPYNIMVLVVLTRVWVEKKAWQTEPVYVGSWRTIPGLVAHRT